MRPGFSIQDARDSYRKKLLRAAEYLEMVRDRAESVGALANLTLFPDHIFDFVLNTTEYPKLDADLRATHSIACLIGMAEGMDLLPIDLMRAAVAAATDAGMAPIVRREHPQGRSELSA